MNYSGPSVIRRCACPECDAWWFKGILERLRQWRGSDREYCYKCLDAGCSETEACCKFWYYDPDTDT